MDIGADAEAAILETHNVRVHGHPFQLCVRKIHAHLYRECANPIRNRTWL